MATARSALLVLLAMPWIAASAKWEQVLDAAPWGVRAAPHGVVTNDGDFIVCSGRVGYIGFYSDCWSSPDGNAWTALPPPAWSQRAYPDIVKLENGTLILLGGEGNPAGFDFMNDIWRSDDNAQTWTRIVKHAPWAGRAGHKSFVVEGEIWVLGGGVRTLLRKLLNDVWVSGDGGFTWEQRTAAAEWSPRAGMEIAVLDGKVYLMGGDHDVPVFSSNGPNYNDVWSTADGGRSWQLVLDAAPWSTRTGHKCAQRHGGTIYCVGGAHQNGTTFLLHDVWASDDARNWTQVSNTAWGCASDATSCGKDDCLLLQREDSDTLYTFGGDEETGSGGGQDNSVWKFSL